LLFPVLETKAYLAITPEAFIAATAIGFKIAIRASAAYEWKVIVLAR